MRHVGLILITFAALVAMVLLVGPLGDAIGFPWLGDAGMIACLVLFVIVGRLLNTE